ncbi:MAG: histidine phosphatase family protein [Microthrixaceae bacterium]|nr:histidine phosphatase family protein [Microthrixaceae bacterium]
MTRILLVRHGQSTWNEAGLWQGQANPPLTDLGRRQARIAALSVGTVDLVCSSRLDRARETAQVLADAIGIGPVLELEGMAERDAGEWSGMTRAEIDHRYPDYLATGRRPGGWEPDEALSARVMGTLDALVERFAGSDILCVTHGGVIMQIEEGLGAGRHRVANLGGRWLDHHPQRGYGLGDRLDLLAEHDVTIPDQI